MKLIIIVIAFLTEQHLGSLERWRDWRWLHWLADRLHTAFAGSSFWGGPLGVIATLAPPLLLAKAVYAYSYDHMWLVWVLLQVVTLLYSMGPHDLINLVDRYVRALNDGNTAELNATAAELTGQAELQGEQRPQAVLESIFTGANRRLFALYFWFAVLGGVGALLMRGLVELRPVSTSRTLGFSHAADRLHALMMWIPTRLFALGFALAGSLTHTFDRWSIGQTLHADENDNLVKAAGLGALQFDRTGQALGVEEERDWVEQARGLVGRTFLVWLTVLGLMTLYGWAV
jgi:membrane protein required for beta-lactamase induction